MFRYGLCIFFPMVYLMKTYWSETIALSYTHNPLHTSIQGSCPCTHSQCRCHHFEDISVWTCLHVHRVLTYMWQCFDLAQSDFLYGQLPLSSETLDVSTQCCFVMCWQFYSRCHVTLMWSVVACSNNYYSRFSAIAACYMQYNMLD